MLKLDQIANPAFICLAAKKARRYLVNRQWYHNRGSQEAFSGALTFRAWQLASGLRNGTYEPSTKTVFAAPKKVAFDPATKSENYQFRPLAIQKFTDEVVETALVMAFADAFEQRWGDPETSNFPELCSYGNRIFRSETPEGKRLSLGSSHLYRDWPEDYSRFVKNTASAFNATLSRLEADECVVLYSSDMSNFYPTVNRQILLKKVANLEVDEGVQQLLSKTFGQYDVASCSFSSEHGAKLTTEGLLQGPVHSGFWSNVYLSDHDDWIRAELVHALRDLGVECQLEFYGRYVDDFHLVLKVRKVEAGDGLKETIQDNVSQAIQGNLGGLGLSLSVSKTSVLIQNAAGTLLTTGQVADRMAAITRKAYFPMPPEELVDLEAEIRYLFGAPRESLGTHAALDDASSAPLLDNPGVRDASRKRFAAGKWLRVARELDSLKPGWRLANSEFASELMREWVGDPTQVQLLHRSLDAGLRPADMTLFLKRLNALNTPSARPFYDFVWGYLLDQNVYSGKDYGLPYAQVVDEAIKSQSNPMLVQRSFAWRLKNKRSIDSPENRIGINMRDKYWLARQLLWKRLDAKPAHFTPFELGALIASVRPSDRVVGSLGSKALTATLRPDDRAQLLRSLLLRRPKPTLQLAGVWNVEIPELGAFDAKGGDGLLYRAILSGNYRGARQWFELAHRLGELLENEAKQSLMKRGAIHPFSLRVHDDGSLSVEQNPAILTAYSAGSESRDASEGQAGWAYPVGLILRAAATGDPQDLLGATPVSRFSMAGTLLWLARKGARLGSRAADLLDRLSWWPGSKLTPFDDVEGFLATVEALQSSLAIAGDIVLGDVHVSNLAGNSGLHCIALCQLRSAPSNVSDASVRRALAITRTILREHQVQDDSLNLVVFPELSVPRGSIGTLCRFSRMTGCVVLAGLSLAKSSDGSRQLNELAWIVPLDRKTGRVVILKQEKIFVTQKEAALTPPVLPAAPPVIWRVLADNDRMSAINCYEFTYLPLRELLRGRVEMLVVSANNQDVTTFDNLMESTHYDIYGHVVLANSEQHGGSAIRAPYRNSFDRRIFDIHGADLFSVNVCYARLSDFRVHSPSKDVKHRPAGFKVHAP